QHGIATTGRRGACRCVGGCRLTRRRRRWGRAGGQNRPGPDDVRASTRLRFLPVAEDVMDVSAIPGADFTGLNPSILGEVGRDLEVLIVDRASRRYLIVGLHLEHASGRANLPAVRELR